MMSDWQKGDLALCLEGGPPRESVAWDGTRYYRETYRSGAILIERNVYTVCLVGDLIGGIVGLSFAEEEGPWASSRFRKIRPSAIKHIEALKDIPVPARETENA